MILRHALAIAVLILGCTVSAAATTEDCRPSTQGTVVAKETVMVPYGKFALPKHYLVILKSDGARCRAAVPRYVSDATKEGDTFAILPE